jgi:hypothetical protein
MKGGQNAPHRSTSNSFVARNNELILDVEIHPVRRLSGFCNPKCKKFINFIY